MLSIEKFTVEHQEEGCVTDERHPRFSFQLKSDGECVCLKRAVLQVNGWKTETDRQIGIRYQGEELRPFCRYEAKVVAEDNRGEQAEAAVCFETGRMGLPWDASWITDGTYHFTEKHSSPRPMTFVKKLQLKASVKEAKIYATALGVYELMLDGEKVGDRYFAPGFTSYRHSLQYQTYDVTNRLKADSTMMAVVAGGWAVGSFTYKRVNRTYAKRQAFLLELHVVYEDGTKEIIGTDDSWQVTTEGAVKEAEFYNGEVYDAATDLSASLHPAAVEVVKLHPEILADYGEKVVRQKRMEPVGCVRSSDGKLLYDFGQNFAGVISMKVRGRKGQKIVLRHAEILMDGRLYTEPLRTARQEIVYICREGEQTYSPRLTYMGFRYVDVEGVEAADIELCAYVLCSDVADNGSFTCSEERINRLQSNIRWGARSNFVDIPTDCPQRDERMGWTGDIALFAPVACYNFSMGRFLEKWLKDVKAEQTFGGGIPMIVPLVRVPGQWEIMLPMAVDHWGDACILVPWAEYGIRGDENILKEMYPVMKKYIKACKFWAGLFSFGKRRYVWQLLHHYGDWVAPGVNMWTWMRRGKYTATASMARCSGLVAEIAEILGEKEEAAYYRSLKEKTSKAYREVFMKEDCRIPGEFQTAYVLPLHYEMLEGEDKRKTAAHLARLIRENDYHIGTGFPGTPYILFALCDNGYEEEAFRMLMQDTCPSWLYEVKTGGTTIWERWDALREDGSCNTGEDDGTGGMTSFNHYASGAVGDFLYKRIAGIEGLQGGYKSFRVKPLVHAPILAARGSVVTGYGEIVSDWRVEHQTFTIRVTVPVSTTCTLVMPSGEEKRLGSGTYVYEEPYE